MPRGAKLTTDVEELIAKVCIEHPEWLAKPSQIQQEVIRQLPDSLKAWGGPNWPAKATIQDRLRKKIRPKLENKPPEVENLDSQWTVGCLANYDMPPDALQIVMRIYEKRLRQLKQDFTIREAIWIARLSKCIDDLIVLEHFASVYALSEKIDWILGKPTLDRGLDIRLIQGMNKQITSADIERFPGMVDVRLTEEQENELKAKGYDITSLGMKSLVEELDRMRDEIRAMSKDKRLPEELRKGMAAFALNYSERRAQDERSHTSKG